MKTARTLKLPAQLDVFVIFFPVPDETFVPTNFFHFKYNKYAKWPLLEMGLTLTPHGMNEILARKIKTFNNKTVKRQAGTIKNGF